MTQILDKPRVDELERLAEPTKREPPVRKRTGFVRWLGWLLAAFLVLGIGALTWYVLSDEPVEVAAPTMLSEIDLYENPELKGVVPGLLMPPKVSSIDPHESPEIMRVPVAPALATIDLHENPELTGFTGQAPATFVDPVIMDPNNNPHMAVPGNVDPNNNPHSE